MERAGFWRPVRFIPGNLYSRTDNKVRHDDSVVFRQRDLIYCIDKELVTQ